MTLTSEQMAWAGVVLDKDRTVEALPVEVIDAITTMIEAARLWNRVAPHLEAAPTVVTSDGEDGFVFHVVTDDALLETARGVADENGWNDEERDGLYQAMCEFLDKLGVEMPTA